MNSLKLLDPDERARFRYLNTVFEQGFETTHLTFQLSGILTGELLNLLSLCTFLFEEYGFPDPEYNDLLYLALTTATAQYLEVYHFWEPSSTS